MSDDSKDNLEFSLGGEDGLPDLLQNINSSYSASLNCSYEYSDEVDDDLLPQEEMMKAHNKRKGIPEDVKELTTNFMDALFQGFRNQHAPKNHNVNIGEFNKLSNESKTTASPVKDSSKNANANPNSFFSSNNNFNKGPANKSQPAKFESKFGKGENQVILDKPFNEMNKQNMFLNENTLVPASVGNAYSGKTFKLEKNGKKFLLDDNLLDDDQSFIKKNTITEIIQHSINKSDKISVFNNKIVTPKLEKISHITLPPINSRPSSARQNFPTSHDSLKYLIISSEQR